MGIILGLAAAILYGGSDFGGGLASRRLGSLPVTVVSSIAAAVLAWVALGVSGGPGPTVHGVAWGLAGGLGGGAGSLILYRGLARGQMSVVGPVSAVAAAAVPVAVGIAMGDRPPLLAMAGLGLCTLAVVAIALQGGGATWLQLTSLAGTSHTRPVVTDAIVPGTPDTGPAWGYHGYEYNLALGSLLHDVAGEEAAWQTSN